LDLFAKWKITLFFFRLHAFPWIPYCGKPKIESSFLSISKILFVPNGFLWQKSSFGFKELKLKTGQISSFLIFIFANFEFFFSFSNKFSTSISSVFSDKDLRKFLCFLFIQPIFFFL
jgi:hypothetical protein